MVFGKLIRGLAKTRDSLVGGLRRLVGRGPLDADTLDQMEELLYTSDLGPAAGQLMDSIREANRKGILKEGEQVEPFVRETLLEIMGEASLPLVIGEKPHVILVCGVNGSGKTTSIAKLSKLLLAEGHSVMLAACDTFRAAAVEQLTIWADRLDIRIVKRNTGADPSGLAFDAADAAAKEGIDVLIVDTAGRLHTQKNLMAELEKICRVLGRRIEGAPHEILLILDGTTGQNAITQAREFRESVNVTSLMVSKLDGTARGGAIVSIREQLGLPVTYIGVGEAADDIERFDPDSFVDALFTAE
ncbi:MAG: signal recognition particle-docking protein FtsY [Planctomycetota bacterium]|nr:signal recognition particle-docking protein FtsY [Planctomycetota bacterium]